MKSPTLRWLAGVVVMLAAGCNHVPQDGPPANSPEQPSTGAVVRPTSSSAPVGELPLAPVPDKKLYAKSFLNRQAPELFVDRWVTSHPRTQGKMVLIDFWATWCVPCCQAIPHLNELHRRFADRLVVVGLSQETAEA